MVSSSTDRQSIPASIDQRTQECLSLIKNSTSKGNSPDVIILLGRKGVGKSSVLEDLAGAKGHSKDANNEDIVTEKFQIEKMPTDDRPIFVMDTPGFDNGEEVATFYEIHRGIQAIRNYVQSWGILYVTKIECRREAIDEKLLEFIKCFSGTDFAPNITVVTTHWNWQHENEKLVKDKWLENNKEL